MSLLDAVIIIAAGLAAGTINTVVGSGSLITFPTLLALGYPPVLANVSNNIGLVPGALSGVIGYRRELVGQRPRLARLVPASLLGGFTGALLLLQLPSSVFRRVVVVLIVVALLLVIFQPRLAARLALPHGATSRTVRPLVIALVFAAGIYGGYFGAAQGIIVIAVLGVFIDDDLQRLNAVKNVLTMSVNLMASAVFVLSTAVDWKVVGCIAAGSVVGGQIGATVGRRLDRRVLRGLIVVVGLTALWRLL